MTSDQGRPLTVRQQEASELCEREEDQRVKHLMLGLMTSIATEASRSGEAPVESVDMLFVLRASQRFFSDSQLLDRILRGEGPAW